MIRLSYAIFGFILWVAVSAISTAQQSEHVATVNDHAISLNVVHHFLDRSFQNLPELADREKRDESVIKIGIEHMVKREIILQHLRTGKFRTSERELDNAIMELKSRLELTQQTLPSHLEKIQLSEQELRQEFEWQFSWRRYVTKYVTVEHLEKQFEEKRKYFDGTKYHVAQILWKQKDKETTAKAMQVRQQLVQGSIKWADAVKSHSQAASAAKEGDLGWIGYEGPMPRQFTRVAFGLATGEFSQPFESQYGIHLIRCIEIEPGSKTFDDVAFELRELETNRLFDLVSTRHRADAAIEISGETVR